MAFTEWCVRNQLKLIAASVVGATIAVLSCNPVAPTSSSSCLAKGALSALIDGVRWTAACVDAVFEPAFSRLTVTGYSVDGAQVLTLTVVATGLGDYPLGGMTPPLVTYPSSSASLNINCQPHPGLCPAWFVSPCCGQIDGNGSGNVTVTYLTGTAAKGLFSLDLVPNSATGASGNKIVTSGTFAVTF